MQEKIFIGTAEAAELLGIGVNKVKYFASVRYHDFPAVRDGGKYLINRKMLNDWAEKMTEENVGFQRTKE